MAIWLVRAGSLGEHEQKFITEQKIYLTWTDLNIDLSKIPDRVSLNSEITRIYRDENPNRIKNWIGQIWSFAKEFKKGDLVIVPLKTQSTIQVGEITGDYQFNENNDNPFYHCRSVKWIGESIPRTNFGQDLLYSFGSLLTICRIQRNNAETRISNMLKNGWKAESVQSLPPIPTSGVDGEDEKSDLEQLARDRIISLISTRFKGHHFTRLVEAILNAQGYTTYRSNPGPDGGADILAGTGTLGFDGPKLVVEVKSGDTAIDRPTVDKLLGAVSKYGASEGLFVSWAGYKNNVQKELATSFFKVRLWSSKELLEALFANYDRLDEDIKAELPLKRIWTVALAEDV